MADVREGLDPVDYRYIVDKPDPKFSPERNKLIVDETIRETDEYWRTQHDIVDKVMGERVDILSTYARYRFNKGTKKIEEFLGRKQYEAIIGEKILSKIRVAETVQRLSGGKKLMEGTLL